MITLGDLKTRANFRMVLALDMGEGAYHNQYVSQTFPRLTVVKIGGKNGPDKVYETHYYVDDIECGELSDVLAMLNTVPHPKRTDLDRHQNSGEDDD